MLNIEKFPIGSKDIAGKPNLGLTVNPIDSYNYRLIRLRKQNLRTVK